MNVAIGAALCILACATTGLAMAIATGKAVDAVARQPEASGKINSILLLGLALAESCAIYGFVTALIMIFVLKIAGIVLVGVIRLVFMILALLYQGMEEGHGMGGSTEMLDLPDSGKPMNPVIDFILPVIVCIILLIWIIKKLICKKRK